MPKFYDKVDVLKKPGWLKIRLHRTPEYAEVQQIVDKHALHTICSSGMCPNKAECWSRRTATFMILGDICTRGCRFCATKTGHPLAPDAEEPRRVAESVALMKLRYRWSFVWHRPFRPTALRSHSGHPGREDNAASRKKRIIFYQENITLQLQCRIMVILMWN